MDELDAPNHGSQGRLRLNWCQVGPQRRGEVGGFHGSLPFNVTETGWHRQNRGKSAAD